MQVREFVDSVQSIIAVADLVKNKSSDGNAPMADLLYALNNAGISMDYDKFKSVYDANPQLKNTIQQFDAETVTFAGGEPAPDAPAGDIPPEEKVSKMAKRAMNKREDVNEEDDMDREMSAEEEQFVDMVVDYYRGDMEDAYSIAGDVPRGTSSRRADYLHREITSRLGIREMDEDHNSKSLKAKIDRLEDENQHGQVALELAKAYGTELEVNLINAINAVHNARGNIEIEERDLRDSITRKYYKKMMSMESSIDEGMHDNVVDKLRQIVDQQQIMPVKFMDGTSRVDMFTASAFVKVYDKVNDSNKLKMASMAETKDGFLRLMKKVFSMLGEGRISVEGHSPHKKGSAKYKKHMAVKHAAMGEGKIFESWQAFKERSLTKAEKGKMRSYEKKIDKKDFIKRYGAKEGPGAYYGTLTKMAKANA